MFSGNQISKLFSDKYPFSEDESKYYVDYHSDRIAYLLNVIQDLCNSSKVDRILDIGPSFLTFCIKTLIKPDRSVATLGWRDFRYVPVELISEHMEFDLNDCDGAASPGPEPFDLIVFAETIEHLYTSPKSVLRFLRRMVRDDGGILIIQTPNAVSLENRYTMVRGINPFELIREGKSNPGHFREYTMDELIAYAEESGFSVKSKNYISYWPIAGGRLALVRRLFHKLHPPFRNGICLVLTAGKACSGE